jgi:hypothetical protein
MNVEEARALVLGVMEGSLGEAWHLDEFPAGWLVVRDDAQGAMGATTIAVEHETGRVLSFPSSVPPRMITMQWDRVKGRGKILG